MFQTCHKGVGDDFTIIVIFSTILPKIVVPSFFTKIGTGKVSRESLFKNSTQGYRWDLNCNIMLKGPPPLPLDDDTSQCYLQVARSEGSKSSLIHLLLIGKVIHSNKVSNYSQNNTDNYIQVACFINTGKHIVSHPVWDPPYVAFRLACRSPPFRFDDDICATAQMPLAAEQ